MLGVSTIQEEKQDRHSRRAEVGLQEALVDIAVEDVAVEIVANHFAAVVSAAQDDDKRTGRAARERSREELSARGRSLTDSQSG